MWGTKTSFAVLLTCLQIIVGRAMDERIWIDATVNDKPTRFIFDTGSPGYILFQSAADRLGLAVTNLPASSDPGSTNDAYTGYTAPSLVKIRDDTLITSFWIIESPPPFLKIGADGFFGWPSITNCIVMIDAKADKVERYHTLPKDITGWLKFPLEPGADYLRLIIPRPGGKRTVLAVDTGSALGVKLRPDLWREWRLVHTNQPVTMNANFMFGAGVTYSEELWAKELTFGPLKLTEVPVTIAGPIDLDIGAQDYEATLGMAALKRLDIIIDAIHNVAYLRPKNEKPEPYKQSRLGAAFVPPNDQSREWIAHVLKNGPAYNAGMRDGDILLAIDGQKIKTTQDYIVIGERMRDVPSGTKVTFSLKRGTETFTTSIVMRTIIGP